MRAARAPWRDRAGVLAGIFAVTGMAWIYLLRYAANMHPGAPMADMPMPTVGVPGLFVMWTVMMAAMMLPSTIPVVMLVATLDRQRRARAAPTTPAALFVCGYVLVWTTFSLVAASAQWTLHHAALLAPSMASTSRVLSGALLVVAGVYQWLPAKYACLSHCRSPFGFVTTEWREGRTGALIMGLRHGAICLGCCWALMALLFVAGVMNVLWIAVLATLVLLEKLVPAGVAIARGAGLAFVAWGVWLLAVA